jgi:hypothetical protein
MHAKHSERRLGLWGKRVASLRLAINWLLLWASFQTSQAAPIDSPKTPGNDRPARLDRVPRITRLNGVPTLQVDGQPFLIVGAQCDIWRSTRQDERTLAFFDGYKAMHATVVSVGIPWSKIELAKDHYDFKFLDWFVEQARRRGLRLILNLFNSNVCGKVQEGASPGAYPQYTPDYLLSAPQDYQRMQLPGPWTYDAGGPPMCPNDPRTLERERLLCAQIARHLLAADAVGTVIMIQIDNEFYYQQWAGKRPEDEKSIRCHCRFCEEKWPQAAWKDGEDFMFHAFADYVRALTETIGEIYPLPLYLNSPWWPPHVLPIFLERCPRLAVVGVDGTFDPREPNMLSRSQVGRNIPFAAENPTEEPKTRLNLDVLPYYTLIGQWGIGNLLWECSPPRTVVEDPVARQRYGAALYPIRWAQWPIAQARGTERLLGWYALRELAQDLAVDKQGNYLATNAPGTVVVKTSYFIREGARARLENAGTFKVDWNQLHIEVRDSAAGILVKSSAREFVLALPRGRLVFSGMNALECVEGRFEADRFTPERTFPVEKQGDAFVIQSEEPKVIRLKVNP